MKTGKYAGAKRNYFFQRVIAVERVNASFLKQDVLYCGDEDRQG